MPRKSEPYKVIGIRPCGEISKEIYGTKEWYNYFFEQTVIVAKALGGKPKQDSEELGSGIVSDA